MEINQLKQQLKDGKFDKWYIFAVEESAVARIYIHKIAEKADCRIEYVDSIVDVYSKLRQKSLIKIRHLYVIVNDEDFLKNEKAWAALEDGRDLKDDIVIFYYTETDKRLKFWKKFNDRAVEFNKLDDRVLVKYIKKDMPISDKNCKRFIEMVEGDYSTAILEMDKVKQYLNAVDPTGDDITWDKGFEKLVNDGTIYQRPKDAIFDFVNAVLERNANKAYSLLEQSYAVGEANMVLLSVLYSSFRNLLQVQSCRSHDISKSTGLTGFQIKNSMPFVNNYTTSELIYALRVLRGAEIGIKRGELADEISVNYALVNIL